MWKKVRIKLTEHKKRERDNEGERDKRSRQTDDASVARVSAFHLFIIHISILLRSQSKTEQQQKPSKWKTATVQPHRKLKKMKLEMNSLDEKVCWIEKGNEPVNAHNHYYMDDENEKVRFSPLHVELKREFTILKRRLIRLRLRWSLLQCRFSFRLQWWASWALAKW